MARLAHRAGVLAVAAVGIVALLVLGGGLREPDPPPWHRAVDPDGTLRLGHVVAVAELSGWSVETFTAAAKEAGFVVGSNRTDLVITEPAHGRQLMILQRPHGAELRLLFWTPDFGPLRRADVPPLVEDLRAVHATEAEQVLRTVEDASGFRRASDLTWEPELTWPRP